MTDDLHRFEDDTVPPADAAVTVFWRPGCMFCSSLLRGLERTGLAFDRVDIWEDEDAAAFVRSVADGNETVPTVRIGDLALVNPSTRDVLRAVADRDPDALPETARGELAQGGSGRVGQILGRLFGADG
ncbi:MAG: NrdH-redoxin [Actinobacteria bacterium]|jgi:glutaredoxin-like protein|nr:NrdH-redoxin [Actinomycetota bacterium]